LKRRGLALEVADILSWECHEKLRHELMSSWARRQPQGYATLTIGQVRRADEVAFTILAKLTCAGIKKQGGVRPMDACVEKVLGHRDFNLALQPLPGRGAAEQPAESGKRGLADESQAELSRHQRRKAAKLAAKLKQAAAAGQGSSGGGPPLQAALPPGPVRKGDGKGKTKATVSKLPLALRVDGAQATDAGGNPICFAFNLGGCPGAPPGGRCPKGRHVCVLKKCAQAAHGYGATHGGVAVQ